MGSSIRRRRAMKKGAKTLLVHLLSQHTTHLYRKQWIIRVPVGHSAMQRSHLHLSCPQRAVSVFQLEDMVSSHSRHLKVNEQAGYQISAPGSSPGLHVPMSSTDIVEPTSHEAAVQLSVMMLGAQTWLSIYLPYHFTSPLLPRSERFSACSEHLDLSPYSHCATSTPSPIPSHHTTSSRQFNLTAQLNSLAHALPRISPNQSINISQQTTHATSCPCHTHTPTIHLPHPLPLTPQPPLPTTQCSSPASPPPAQNASNTPSTSSPTSSTASSSSYTHYAAASASSAAPA